MKSLLSCLPQSALLNLLTISSRMMEEFHNEDYVSFPHVKVKDKPLIGIVSLNDEHNIFIICYESDNIVYLEVHHFKNPDSKLLYSVQVKDYMSAKSLSNDILKALEQVYTFEEAKFRINDNILNYNNSILNKYIVDDK